jgi:2,3-diaminopropionate biosynthesis protein SbnB
MYSRSLLVLCSNEIQSCLYGHELEIVDAVKRAYLAHRLEHTVLPNSAFLRLPKPASARIIALPAYLADGHEIAGVKWISSFPSNSKLGLDRASAIIAINNVQTGRADAILEGSLISAHRTAASAALAAQTLHGSTAPESIGLIGCGVINWHILHYCLQLFPQLEQVIFFDVDPAKAKETERRASSLRPELRITSAASLDEVLRASQIVSFATTASVPYVDDLSQCQAGATILHISLRDLSPRVVLQADNVVDDVEHVCREGTSLHLATQLEGKTSFVRCSLADILSGNAPNRAANERAVIFSPFGLGILDLAVANLVLQAARDRGVGTSIADFHPAKDSIH